MSYQLLVTDQEGQKHRLKVAEGAVLRDVLLQNDLSPYTVITNRLNCGGNGLCATCGVWITSGAPPPRHWHDKLAKQYGYPRLSCQVRLYANMDIVLPQKWIWGSREAAKRRRTR